MWKDFFYYSKSERRAVFFLLVLILLLLVAIVIYSKRDMAPSKQEAVNTEEVDSFLTELKRLKIQPVKSGKNGDSVPAKPKDLFEFNPNLADSIEFSRLGLNPFAIRNILKYRAKGGYFKTPASFARVYGLSPELFAELEPYIRIPEQLPVNRKRSNPRTSDTLSKEIRQSPVEKYPKGTLLDANLADTMELKKIPGIGSVIARNIVAYRQRLGGFYDLNQLCEVRFFTPELLEWFVLGDSSVRKLHINQESLEELRAHPYLNFYQTKVIVDHRRKKGKIESLSQLSLYEEFTEKDLNRLSAYINFD